MTRLYLSVSSVGRRTSTGSVEELAFDSGVNLLVGRPNTGKTKWLQTLDFLLGDLGENPFEGAEEAGLSEKYEAAFAELIVAGDPARVERKWREPGAKSKIFVNGDSMSARDFQHWLMDRLEIPLLNFPKGNPMSGQTWPELSFRILLRHIYRQQRFWSGIADQQPDGEQHASLLQFLGLAERIYTDDYGQLVKLKIQLDKLRARREQYVQTLEDLARDLLGDQGLSVSVTRESVQTALERIEGEVAALQQRRNEILTDGSRRAVTPDKQGHVELLGEERAHILVTLENVRRKREEASNRAEEIRRYRRDLAEELDRIARTEDAASVLSDLRITHCPACDQAVEADWEDPTSCFLCHQHMRDEPVLRELGEARIRFERDRLHGELKEADSLLDLLKREEAKLGTELSNAEESLRSIDLELAPAREAVAALVQEEVSAADVALGQASERDRQLRRVSAALDIGADMSIEIDALATQIEPIQRRVGDILDTTDFGAPAALLEDGMNSYLNAINVIRPDIWKHSPVRVDITKSSFTIRVGERRWGAALGGTDTLYFLMAYHYGLLTLSNKPGCHYPGLSIIDLPGEFLGEAIEDKENFIVQPFIDLLSRDEYQGVQLIMTGASFIGLEGTHFQRLTHVHIA